MKENKYSIGIDFGTESARAVLVNIRSGDVAAASFFQYPDGVIDRRLPESGPELPPEWALQNPADWLEALQKMISEMQATGGIDPADVVGLGVDFTSCTVLPAARDGTPLCRLKPYRNRPHAWPKLWKHHAAQSQADKINRQASENGETWLRRYGGKISSEWTPAKALQILEDDADIYAAADYLVEGADWIVWQLTGGLVRNSCCAGYKAAWHRQDGFPSPAFLESVHPGFGDLYTLRYGGQILDPGRQAGGLTQEWAEKLGLRTGLPVAAGIIDAHAAVLGGGVSRPGTMFLIMGTSTCHMLMSEKEVLVEGISGVVQGGIVPGLFAYEAGQASVGDIFAWFVENQVPGSYEAEARERGVTIHDYLTELAERRRPGQSGLIALDWWNGCRTPLVNANLSGAVLGYTLQTKPEDVYRALLESTAYGTRVIVELFRDAGVPIERLRVGGGLVKNKLLLQIYADCIGVPIEVAASPQPSAIGAAILGAMCSGYVRDVHAAVESMAPAPDLVVRPQAENMERYIDLFRKYKELADELGRNPASILKGLHDIRNL